MFDYKYSVEQLDNLIQDDKKIDYFLVKNLIIDLKNAHAQIEELQEDLSYYLSYYYED